MSGKHLLARAFEEQSETTKRTESAEDRAPQEGGDNEERMVVIQGPLSAVFSKALAEAYAKPDSVAGVAAESQANDQITGVAALLAEQAAVKGNGDTVHVFEYPAVYKSAAQPGDAPEPVAVTRDLSKVVGQVPTSFIFYQDCTSPTSDAPTGGETTRMLPVIESIEIVVHTRKRPAG